MLYVLVLCFGFAEGWRGVMICLFEVSVGCCGFCFVCWIVRLGLIGVVGGTGCDLCCVGF